MTLRLWRRDAGSNMFQLLATDQSAQVLPLSAILNRKYDRPMVRERKNVPDPSSALRMRDCAWLDGTIRCALASAVPPSRPAGSSYSVCLKKTRH
jgi:hypothetical protein